MYGGNYDFYLQEKEKQLNALNNRLIEKEKELRKIKKVERETMEKQQKHDIRGEKQNRKKGIPRIMMGNLKSQAQRTSAKLKEIHRDKIQIVNKDLIQLKNSIPDFNNLKLNINNADLHKGKILVDAEGINFGYTSHFLWKYKLNFQIISGYKYLIKGDNGSGKTTLIRLILGDLIPTIGFIKKNEFTYLYVDQNYSNIKNHLSVYEQILFYNSGNLLECELKTILNWFLFPKETWDKKNKYLSGGEKMRLLLCCLQISNNMPDIIILDEPTNNLDIQSLEILQNAISSYEGTLLVISHDESFIKEIKISTLLELI